MSTFTATFTPEVWVNDEAVIVNPEGDTEWTVSPDFEDAAAAIVAEGFFGLDRDDVLHDDPAAPLWVRDWPGPFSIHVEVEDEVVFTRPECAPIISDAVCQAGCCSPACHTALCRPCCGWCMSQEAQAARNRRYE